MPFTKDGIVPDIIMNPNAIPKRMTIGQLIECIYGKVGTIAGTELDATPFRKVTVENISEIMEGMGYNGAGTEILYNGKTGEQIKAAIFIGPTFYYRLKHLVEDKQHCIDYETEILTLNGWKQHNTLKMTDKVATLVDGKLVYENPIEIFHYPDHVGDMYYVNNSRINLAVTSEHKMYISTDGKNYGFQFAKDIVNNHEDIYYKKNAEYDDPIESKKSREYIDEAFGDSSTIIVSSQEEADKVQQHALHAGYAVDIEGNVKSSTFKCILFRDNFDVKGNGIWINECESKPVWCISVSSQVFMIRRNGKVSWTGNSRATGPYQLLTMQPAEGRSRDGGFRFGEMERDNMLSHGTVQFLKERTFDCSDKYMVWVDEKSGMISPVNPDKGIYKSLYTDNTTKFSKVQIPYASKLLIQELMSMHINARMMVKK